MPTTLILVPPSRGFQTFLRPCTAKPVASHLYAESFPSNTCITNDQKLIVMHEFETNQHSVNSLHTLNLFVMCSYFLSNEYRSFSMQLKQYSNK